MHADCVSVDVMSAACAKAVRHAIMSENKEGKD